MKHLLASFILILLFTQADPVQAQAGCSADFNHDLVTKTDDLKLILPQIYTGNYTIDINADGKINSPDLARAVYEVAINCRRPLPSTVTGKITMPDTVTSLYRVADPTATVSALIYQLGTDRVSADDETGNRIWIADISRTGWTTQGLFGGFDFDSDGWTDLAAVHFRRTGTCGNSPSGETAIVFINGKNGALYYSLAPLADKCWNFSGTVYPTSQWTNLSVLFGPAGLRTVTVVPYYATQGWFMDWSSTGLQSGGTFYYPSTSSFDSTYPNARQNLWTGTKYVENSHIANGLMVEVQGQKRVIFFTSGRVVQYAVLPLGGGQLLSDLPFTAVGAGRNYGLVSINPENRKLISLIAGTDAYTIAADFKANAVTSDPWGQIERHVAVYNLETNTIEDRFYSNAHDNNDGNQYVNRVVYPAHPWIKTGKTPGSRMAYNVYADGHWQMHISSPGTTTDTAVVSDLIIWDIRDLDGNGIDEIMTSPADCTRPTVVGCYFPQSETKIYHWDETIGHLVNTKNFAGGIPYLVSRFRESERTTSRSFLYDSVSVYDQGQAKLVLTNASGGLEPVPFP